MEKAFSILVGVIGKLGKKTKGEEAVEEDEEKERRKKMIACSCSCHNGKIVFVPLSFCKFICPDYQSDLVCIPISLSLKENNYLS